MRRIRARFQDLPTMELVQVMTLLLVLAPGPGRLHVLVAGAALAGLAIRRLRESTWLWLVIVLARTADHFSDGWYLVDNHHFLLTYWCLAVAFALASSDPVETIRTNARLLIGACFAFAAAWKLLGAQYLDGSFLMVLFVTTPTSTFLLPGIDVPVEVMTANRSAVAELGHLADPSAGLHPLQGVSPFIRSTAVVLGIWTIGIELLIAAMFLLPSRSGWVRAGDLALIAFVATTYVLAPVLVFGLLLLTMGFGQVRADEVGFRGAYLVGFVLLPPVVLAVLGQPALGLALTGAAFIFAYLQGWGRPMLLAGFLVLGSGIGVAVDPLRTPWASLTLFTGMTVVVLTVTDLLFTRHTERWILGVGAIALVGGLVLDAFSSAWPPLVTLGGLGVVFGARLQQLRRGASRGKVSRAG